MKVRAIVDIEIELPTPAEMLKATVELRLPKLIEDFSGSSATVTSIQLVPDKENV